MIAGYSVVVEDKWESNPSVLYIVKTDKPVSSLVETIVEYLEQEQEIVSSRESCAVP